MKPLKIYLEHFRIGKIKHSYNYTPQNKNELKQILEEKVKEQENSKILDLNDIDVSNIDDFSLLFYSKSLSGVSELNVASWKTSQVINMTNCFKGMHMLKNVIGINNWDVRNVEKMTGMFANTRISQLNLNNWQTLKLTHVNLMFNECKYLKKIQLGEWDTSHITHADGMFDGCKRLTDIDIEQWTFSPNTEYPSFMFYECPNVTPPDWYASKEAFYKHTGKN